MSSLWPVLEQLKQHRWVELSHELTEDSPYWEGMPDGCVDLNSVLMDFDGGFNLKIQGHKLPGQFGTHIDFPGHFVPGARLNKDFPVIDEVLPLVVVDIHEQAATNDDYEVTIDDIKAFEATHGTIPAGTFVALRTDWSKRWPDGEALANVYDGREHAPGWSMEALKHLIEERNVAAVGHETLDTDAPITSSAVDDLQCERYVLAQDRFQVELLANLDQVPATGALIFVGAARIADANGMPVRAWAIVPD